MADQQLLAEQSRAPNGSIVAMATVNDATYDIDKLKINSNGDINGLNSINRKIGSSNNSIGTAGAGTGTTGNTNTTKIVYEFSTNPNEVTPPSFEPPDAGARAWCVMVSGFFCNSIIFGIINTCGTIHTKLVDNLTELGVAEANSKACKFSYMIYSNIFISD